MYLIIKEISLKKRNLTICMIYSLFASVKAFPRALLRLVLKASKVDPLTKQETETFLKNYQTASSPVREVFIPGVQNQGELTKLIFSPVRAVTHPSFVWSYERGTKKRGSTTLWRYSG